jgi:hypothetical protein
MTDKRVKSEIAQHELSDRHVLHAQRRGWGPSPRWVNCLNKSLDLFFPGMSTGFFIGIKIGF